jgi:hypothetical protein
LILFEQFLLDSEQQISQPSHLHIFALDQIEQAQKQAQELDDPLGVGLIQLSFFYAFDQTLDFSRTCRGNLRVFFHRGRSRKSYAGPFRDPRPNQQIFLFSRRPAARTQKAACDGFRARADFFVSNFFSLIFAPATGNDGAANIEIFEINVVRR